MNKKNIILLFIGFLFVFSYSFFISSVFSDEIWNYGFAYNISRGMIPYRDFNLVTTPLFPILASIFIKIFGPYLFSFHVFNSLVITFILFLCYKKLGVKFLFLIPIVILNGFPGYNIFCILLIIIILYLCDIDFKYHDYVLACLVGFVFLTKQTVGVCLFIPMIYYSRNKIKSFMCFLIPNLIFVIYLIWNNAFFQFVDYCFMGLFDFGKSNSIFLCLPLETIICIYLLFVLWKSDFSDTKCFFVLMFQIITIPIMDVYHFSIGLIPVIYFFLNKKNFEPYKIKYYLVITYFMCIAFSFVMHYFQSFHFVLNKNSYLYGRNVPDYVEKSVYKASDYINRNKDNYDNIYIFSANAYWIKLNIKYPLTKYDMICNGNMGYHGADRYIHEIDSYCTKHSCMFILYKYEFREGNITQTNKELVDYVISQYSKTDDIDTFDIYSNKE